MSSGAVMSHTVLLYLLSDASCQHCENVRDLDRNDRLLCAVFLCLEDLAECVASVFNHV